MVTFLFLMLCPLFFSSAVLEPTNVPRFLMVLVLLVLIFTKWLFQKKRIQSISFLLLFLLVGYYFVNLASVCWSLNTADAIYESQKVFLVPCILLLFLNWLQTDREEHLLVKSLILIAFIYELYAVYELLRLPDFNFETLYSVNSFSEHKNLLASYLFLLMAFQVYGIIYFQKHWKGFSVFVFVLTFLLLLFLQTRSVYFALALSAIIFVFYLHKHLKIKRRLVYVSGAGLLLVLVFILLISPDLFQRINVFAYASSASGAERLQVWTKTITLIKENFLSGVGAGNWQYNFSKFGIGDIKNISQNEISFQRPHNDLLWIISETGIIGFLFIVAVIGFVFIKSYSAIKAGNIKALIFFSFLCGLLIESFFSFPKERISHIFLAAIMFAVLLKQLQLSIELSAKSGQSIILLCLLVSGFSALVGTYRFKGEYHTALLLKEKEKNKPAEVINHGQKAISLFYKSDPTSTPIYSYLGWAYNQMNKTDTLLYVSEQAYKIAPYDYEVLSNYGSALDRAGKRDEAREILKEALRINPSYEVALVNLLVVEYNSRDYKKAFQYLMLIPNYDLKYQAYLDKIKMKLGLKDM